MTIRSTPHQSPQRLRTPAGSPARRCHGPVLAHRRRDLDPAGAGWRSGLGGGGVSCSVAQVGRLRLPSGLAAIEPLRRVSLVGAPAADSPGNRDHRLSAERHAWVSLRRSSCDVAYCANPFLAEVRGGCSVGAATGDYG